jgi:CRP-like cAMP-binding protein
MTIIPSKSWSRRIYETVVANSKIMGNSELQETLKSYFPILEEESLNDIVKHSSYLKSTKGTQLISEGKRHHYIYFIVKGSVKSYYSKESKEVCVWFSLENEIIGTTSTIQGGASKETLELLEDSELIKLNIEKIKELAQTDLSISNLLNNLWEEHAIFLEERLYQLQFMNSHERYKVLIKNTPEILQRVSLTDIASFLGLSRETLSRIRAKK